MLSFDISYFRNNPLPFYTLAHELAPGKYKPTVAHCLVRLLADKGLLLKLFTQNIDCLEREAGVPEDLIVEAHGSFASQSCIQCRARYPEELMKDAIENTKVPRCVVSKCNGLVKPDIVFFGEQLPERFHANRTLPARADLCIIMGTSLSVQPFASLSAMFSEDVPRLLINSDRVGDLGSRADDVLTLGTCDDGARKLAAALGWEDELQALWQTVSADVVVERKPQRTKDELLEDEIAKITAEVDRSLKISSSQKQWLEKHLGEKHSLEALSNRKPQHPPNCPQPSEKELDEGNTDPKSQGYRFDDATVKSQDRVGKEAHTKIDHDHGGTIQDDWEDVQEPTGVNTS